MTNAPQTVFLADYTPPAYLVDQVALTFRLAPTATRVISKVNFRRNPESNGGDLLLDGEGLKTISCTLDGAKATVTHEAGKMRISADQLPADSFLFEAEVEISPATNTALEGLYMSNSMYCTQCEAEGFRKITWYPDRPDVMAPFTVRIESEEKILLSNGNPVASGDGWAEWSDPWPKPAYLFALVAGNLVNHPDQLETMSGKKVELNIWVRPGDEGKCAFGMGALKQSMTWDEEVYGREYDLDIFNIVAVDDFNMGAMENKGLNIFNSSAVLASPETSTDANFERIEAIIAHEYFHNWTGNRITCRDWFQLCLKEGLTVFRDQQFSADMRSAPVRRIDDVSTLRGRQFREDNGPLAHPVRPESFVEINNFYTATIYEKGAEIIGMLKRLVGDDAYAKALNLYFERHDGEAATIEDWLQVFEDSTGRDLSQFKLWYSQAGTPRLTVSESYSDGTYTLNLRQDTPATPGQADKQPLVIPVAVGLLSPEGKELVPTTILEMTETEQSFDFEGLSARPVPSLLRGFSAPVVLIRETSNSERAFLLAHDTDPFNKWEAGRMLAKDVLSRMATEGAEPAPQYLDAMSDMCADEALDPAFRAHCLRLPGQDDLAQTLYDAGVTPDPMAIHSARESLSDALAAKLEPLLASAYDSMISEGEFSPDAVSAGRRAMRQGALSLLSRIDGGERARALFATADNMTEQLGALGALLQISQGSKELASFYQQWRDDRLVMDKWFMMQVSFAAPEATAATAARLVEHADFDWKNPNRVRSVLGALSMNAAGFHYEDGASYQLLADCLIRLDDLNPQITARLSGAFETWRRYDGNRQGQMRDALQRILAKPDLSRDATEMVTRLLGD
ncbi:aminopeptidase N [Candidatus Halocynthiibacter alkanivorans]|uniref:aminopeptidase N n=1 Tax=Candidatus Halocynthiibacter alkanivorans TaxID=2267619 RepID=UPI000DF37648|nr:aminopeptidase N [Candidatus Halocynthiibacter alkanivorans]